MVVINAQQAKTSLLCNGRRADRTRRTRQAIDGDHLAEADPAPA
jgi:hypothetical protein